MKAYKNYDSLKCKHLLLRNFSFFQFIITFIIRHKSFVVISLLIIPVFCRTQDTIIISPKVGKVIDLAEKIRFGLLPYYSSSIFISAVLMKSADSTYFLEARLKPDSISERSISKIELEGIRQLINTGQINYQFDKKYNEDYLSTDKKYYHSKLWIKLGVGANSLGLAGSISISLVKKSSIISLHYIRSKEPDINILGTNYPLESASEIGILYGFRLLTESKKRAFTISTGLSLVTGVKRGKFLSSNGWFGDAYYEDVSRSKLGLPIELQFMPNLHAGIGFTLFSNLLESDLSGVLVCLHF